jgi:hypothetical protein
MEEIIKIVFFHIPRTAGSSMWHSMASSFTDYKDLAILDTHHESIKRFACADHEEEILDEFLRDNMRKNYLLHVHSKVNLLTKNDIDVACFGTRNRFTWRTSLISHFAIPEWNISSNQINKYSICQHPQQCRKGNKNLSWGFGSFLTLIDAQHKWISCVIPKNVPPKFQVLSYCGTLQSKLDLGNVISHLIAGENEPLEFKLTRFKNDENTNVHDSKFGIQLLGSLINLITLPIFLAFNLKRVVKKGNI